MGREPPEAGARPGPHSPHSLRTNDPVETLAMTPGLQTGETIPVDTEAPCVCHSIWQSQHLKAPTHPNVRAPLSGSGLSTRCKML